MERKGMKYDKSLSPEQRAEKRRAYQRQYYQERKEIYRQRYQDSKDTAIDYQKNYYQEHKEERLSYQKKYSEENKRQNKINRAIRILQSLSAEEICNVIQAVQASR